MRFKASWIIILVSVALITLMDAACKKPKPLSAGGVLTFSTDTLAFDTVFTTQGSYTNGVMIYNPQGQEVIVSSVRLQDGASSYFHLNVDGFQGNNITNVKIAAHDSVYVFATVKIDPTDTLTPFIIVDHLIATMNGRDFSIPFTAYGQNAHFIVSDSITTDITWKTDKPYVVMHSCVIGRGGILRIPPKCRVYMHQDARFIVYDSAALTIGIGATGADSVVLQGDRLDRGYFLRKEYPGEWGGIWLKPYAVAVIQNTIIKNCGNATSYNGSGTLAAAIEVDSGAKLWIDHSVIRNSIGYGILGVRGNITATNCLVHTCGAQAFGVIVGGADTMTNCTFANYGTAQVEHINNPTVAILSYFAPGGGLPPIPGTLNALLTNCIIYGSLDSEFYCDNSGGGTSNLTMDHCLFGTGWQIPSFLKTNACQIGQAATGFIDPKFVSSNTGNFMLSGTSPAIGAGVSLSWVTDDLLKKMRGGSNDMGCYQHQ